MLDLNKNEEEILKYWKENHILKEVREKNRGKKPFYFLDGPPFVTGTLHPGQLWVKTMKDIFLRYRRSRGFDTKDRAGYDVHGLPIENKVEKELNLTSKKEIETKIGLENFIKRCREYVESYMGKMDADYERYGISLNFSDPYLPYKNEYIEEGWRIFKLIEQKGFLYKDKRTIPYCPHCETSLAQGTMEVAYTEERDPSIIVAFKIDKSKSKLKIQLPEDTSMLIWTTTPWTLPGNVAVAANPKELYVNIEAAGKSYILAKQRLDAVTNLLNMSVAVKSEFYGSELEGIHYINPLETKVPEQKKLRKYHRVVFTETLVSMGEGTGLVHMAPGHGLDDYLIGKEHRLPIFSPVKTDATYGEEAGEYAGLKIPGEANTRVLQDLKSLGVLMDEGVIVHSYPHCWRCDSKVIYIASEQWFLRIQKVKKKLVGENRKVRWHPSDAVSWEEEVLKNSPDWNISRQRYWGIPLPIWVCNEHAHISVIGSLSELRERAINREQVDKLSDLHRPYIDRILIKCEKCGGEMRRVTDVFDVWFDSSISFRASLSEQEFEKLFPIDFILEGKDQLRAWFSVLLKTGVMAYGKKPFNNIVIDGMLLDEKGREMHKKLGNYVSPAELLDTVSADTFRLWSASHTPWLDLLFNRGELEDARKAILVLYNVTNLLTEYQGAIGYETKTKKRISGRGLDSENNWILSRLETTVQKMTGFLDNYEAHLAVNTIKSFITEDLSRFYLKLAKKKILYESKKRARATIDVVNYVFYKTLILASPAIPFTAEKLYLDRYKHMKSISLEDWPRPNKKLINERLENDFEVAKEAITAILNSREKAGIKLRWPIASATLELKDDASYNAVQRLGDVIEGYANTKKLELKRTEGVNEEARPIFARIGPDFKENAAEVAEALRHADARQLRKGVEESGHYPLHTTKGLFDVKAEHFAILEKVEATDAVVFKHGKAYVDEKMTKELKDEALVREFERRVQMIRKELQLKKRERIGIGYFAAGEVGEAIRNNASKICKDINSEKLRFNEEVEGTAREFEIEGERVRVTIKKV